jgi:hypothetical protein
MTVELPKRYTRLGRGQYAEREDGELMKASEVLAYVESIKPLSRNDALEQAAKVKDEAYELAASLIDEELPQWTRGQVGFDYTARLARKIRSLKDKPTEKP